MYFIVAKLPRKFSKVYEPQHPRLFASTPSSGSITNFVLYKDTDEKAEGILSLFEELTGKQSEFKRGNMSHKRFI